MNRNLVRHARTAIAIGALVALTGCASVIMGTEQPVLIETVGTDGKVVPNAVCKLSNDKTTLDVLSGTRSATRRSGADMSVECSSAGQSPAKGRAVSRVNGAFFGNILLGGLIGMLVDSASGAAYTYPSWMKLVFGEDRVFDRNDHRDDSLDEGRPAMALPVAAK